MKKNWFSYGLVNLVMSNVCTKYENIYIARLNSRLALALRLSVEEFEMFVPYS